MQTFSDNPTRSGQYIRQIGGYRAFIPNPLPPIPPIHIDGELQALLSEADLSLGRLDGSIQTLPDSDLFVLMYIRQEALLSSQIEGTQSTLQDVLAAEARILSAGPLGDAYEVINYIEALKLGLAQLETLPVSVRLICQIHARLLQRVRGSHLTPGEVRTSQNWIGGASLSDAAFIPPPPTEVRQALGDLEKFLNDPGDLPTLIWIGLAHAQFETIHPFLDGNGRVGRLLITFLLCERGVLLKPVLYLSHYFKQNRQQYYEELQAVRDSGSWEQWLAFFLRGVIEVSKQATETARRILDLRERHRYLINERLGRRAGNGHRVLDYLFERALLSVKVVQDLNESSYPSANSLVSQLVDCGILHEITGKGRGRVFRYEDYIALFHDGDN